jgi:hypothetical protein
MARVCVAKAALAIGCENRLFHIAIEMLLLSNAGAVAAEELQRSILAARVQLLSEVLPSDVWIEWL